MVSAAERLRAQLAQDLRQAMKARDAARVAALRTLAAALDNATAVPVGSRGAPMPFGAAEVPRKELTDDDVRSLLMREISGRHDAAFELEMHGCFEEALALKAEIEILESYDVAVASGEAQPSAGDPAVPDSEETQ